MSANFKGLLQRIFLAAASLFCLICITSCATFIGTQSEINSSIAKGDYAKASQVLSAKEKTYGSSNAFLYLVDKGYVLHMQRDFKASIDAFQQAKDKYDELYTKSVSRILGSFALNDYALPYRGEDFERVMINIFQALNYFESGDLQGALVEARDTDSVLNLINNRYKSNEKNVYSEDAFARFLAGIFYEAQGTAQGYNDAFISYSKAIQTYENNYARNYGLNAPHILKENLLAAAQFMGEANLRDCVSKYGNLKFMGLKEKAKKADVYLIQYNGFSPVKIEANFPVLLPDGYVMPLAFPKYVQVGHLEEFSEFSAQDNNGRIFKVPSQTAEDIGAIAIKNLDDRKVRTIAKAVVSAAGKYTAEKIGGQKIEKKYGRDSAFFFTLVSDIFNLSTNRADLRSWRTLPSEIRVARLLLDPGEYSFRQDNFDASGNVLEIFYLGEFTLRAGEKKFLVIRTAK